MSILEDSDPLKNITMQFESIMENLNVFKSQITVIQTQIKGLEKNVKKQLNTFKKTATKNKIKGNRKPSGFAKPTKVTKELCEFMNKTEGTEIARTDVTRALISYIDSNNLQNVTNKKIIYPDEKLKCLLGINEDEELTYFTIQKYMNKHFVSLKNEKNNTINETV
jgi:chromatin remodeling complex protein RSC6